MECGICSKPYDSEDKIPRILTKCGHTYCQHCLTSVFKDRSIVCQDCKQTTSCSSVKELPINHSLMQLPSAVHGSNVCLSHGKALEAFCLDDLSLVCFECLLSSKYKGKEVAKIDQAFKECFGNYSKESKSIESNISRGKEMLAQLSSKICSFEKKASLKQQVVAFYDSIIQLLADCRDSSCRSIEREAAVRNEAINQHISNINSMMRLSTEISETRSLDKIGFLKRYKQMRDDLSSVQKLSATIGPKMIPEDLAFDPKKELDTIVASLRSKFSEATRPSTAPSYPPKDKSKKPTIAVNSRPVTAASRKPPSKSDSINSPKKDSSKQPPQPQPNLNQKRNEMKSKKQQLKPSVPVQPTSNKSKPLAQDAPSNSMEERPMKPIISPPAPKDDTHLSLQFLDDQKLSLLGDSILPTGTDFDSARDREKRITPWEKRKLDRLPEDPEDEENEDDSGITAFHNRNQLQMSESKDQTYNLEFYLETFGRDSPQDLNFAKPQAKNPRQPALLKPPPAENIKIYESIISLEDDRDIDCNLYCIGGSPSELSNKLTIDVYDANKKFWTLFHLQEENRAKFGYFKLSDSLLVVFGGMEPKENSTTLFASSLLIDLASLTATPYHFKLSAARCAFASIVINNHLYVFGGNEGSGPICTAEEYDLATGEMRKLKDMRFKRDQPSCSFVEGWIYVAGGGGEKGESLKSVERYHLSTGTWEPQQSLLIERRALSLITAKNQLFAIGGYDGEKFLASVEKYLPLI